MYSRGGSGSSCRTPPARSRTTPSFVPWWSRASRGSSSGFQQVYHILNKLNGCQMMLGEIGSEGHRRHHHGQLNLVNRGARGGRLMLQVKELLVVIQADYDANNHGIYLYPSLDINREYHYHIKRFKGTRRSTGSRHMNHHDHSWRFELLLDQKPQAHHPGQTAGRSTRRRSSRQRTTSSSRVRRGHHGRYHLMIAVYVLNSERPLRPSGWWTLSRTLASTWR